MPGIGNVILDTSVAVAHLRGNSAVTSRLEEVEKAFLPIVALGELLCGVRKSVRTQENMSLLQGWLRSLSLLPLAASTADQYATIKLQLAKSGTPIPENDVWIAAHALELGLPLATRDQHFHRIDGLNILDWR